MRCERASRRRPPFEGEGARLEDASRVRLAFEASSEAKASSSSLRR
jgi:hypothetical protein